MYKIALFKKKKKLATEARKKMEHAFIELWNVKIYSTPLTVLYTSSTNTRDNEGLSGALHVQVLQDEHFHFGKGY